MAESVASPGLQLQMPHLLFMIITIVQVHLPLFQQVVNTACNIVILLKVLIKDKKTATTAGQGKRFTLPILN